MRFNHLFVAALASCLSIGGQAFAQSASNSEPSAEQTEIDPLAYVLPKDKDETFEIGWDDLLPPGEAERTAAQIQNQMQSLFNVTEGGENDVAMQFGTHNTVKILDGHKIRIPGYTVPFEFGKNAKIKEFLLVPYYGACLHAPPPPPNQTIYVKTDKPIKLKDLQQAVWIEGYVHIDSTYTDLAEAAYTVSLTDLEVYDN
ncbi:DUF3299 domain-containing protein [Hirschia baltica]|uniref:Lipoprotein n=1 Tax=Hirschia baltica (strain ATCC 49814 / DSM 5838 / IFAM 1418) TaxID=582402 RepID=C6XJC7_HIRBI|nr:DUF3299 domain-containing protein [Hirschia baltica]ACT59222.1 conserved hypothetical protein [Hirschia baltica ATCC 49814]